LREKKATIFEADKGNMIIIWYTDGQIPKTHDFISNNDFSPTHNYPTKVLKKEIRKLINVCNLTIPKKDKWKYIILNSTAPTQKGLPKFHKNNIPITPNINW